MSHPSARAGSPAGFSLSVTPGAPDELEMWRQAVSPMFEIPPLAPDARSAFGMETTGYFLPGMAISKTTSSGCSFERSRALIARSGIDNILVQVYLSGGYRLETEGLSSQIMAGDIVVCDLTRPSAIRAEPYTNIALTLQRDTIAPMVVDMERLHGLILRSGEPRTLLLTSLLEMLQAQAKGFDPAEQASVVQGTAALVAACLGPSLAVRDAADPGDASTILQLIRRAIDGRLDDPTMSPASLARHFGLSRAAIYRLFTPLGGVQAYIRQRRLMRAYHLITSPSHADEPIGAIAKRLGFPESTAFSRAFRGLYRMTPSAVRAAARSGFPSPQRAPGSSDSFGMLNRWLLGLDANGR